MRLRRGLRTRDLADCGFAFVTSNKFLASSARRFLVEHRAIAPNTFPPMMSVGQVATIAWLLKDQSIPPEKAGRELLTNCFAAVKPDAEWFGYFREGMERITGPLDEYSNQGGNALTLQAARRIAQDESFGNSAIVRQLNMAEILSRAEQEQQRVENEKAAEALAERARAAAELEALQKKSEEDLIESAKTAELVKQEAIAEAVAQARQELTVALQEERRHRANRRAGLVMTAARLVLLVALAVVVVAATYLQISESKLSPGLITLSIVLGLLNIVSLADLLKFPLIEGLITGIRAWIAQRFEALS